MRVQEEDKVDGAVAYSPGNPASFSDVKIQRVIYYFVLFLNNNTKNNNDEISKNVAMRRSTI